MKQRSSESNLGKEKSEETKRNMSESFKKRLSPEERTSLAVYANKVRWDRVRKEKGVVSFGDH